MLMACWLPPECHLSTSRVPPASAPLRLLRSLDDVLAKPPLTMELECQRAILWEDARGVGYDLREEWRYVSGPAVPKPGCTAGTRDEKNAGKLPADFQAEANEFIRGRRRAGYGLQLLEEDALLTLDEVLATRLYSGPAFKPINEFLRELAKLTDNYRCELGRNVRLTFAATVRHLVRALRKLAAVVTPEEARQPLWRGVEGRLPRDFFAPDETGAQPSPHCT